MENLQTQLKNISDSLEEIKKNQPEQWMSYGKACEHASITRPTLEKWINLGLLKPSLIGGVKRLRRSHLDSLLDAHAA